MTSGGRKSYHGQHELIKTNRTVETSMNEIVSKCQIFRMKEYIQGNWDRSLPAFVFRQQYDTSMKKLFPEKLETFGERVPNPDEELFANNYREQQ